MTGQYRLMNYIEDVSIFMQSVRCSLLAHIVDIIILFEVLIYISLAIVSPEK